MSSSRSIEQLQFEAGLIHKPDWMSREANAQALSDADFSGHAREVFRDLDRDGRFSDQRVHAVAGEVVAQWGREGREVVADRDTAEALAFAAYNRACGYTGAGAGAGALFGRAPVADDGEEDTTTLGAALERHQKEMGLR